MATHTSQAELEQGLAHIQASPKQAGRVELIVRRPKTDAREVIEQAELDLIHGLIGDNWYQSVQKKLVRKPELLETQITLMNARTIALIAREDERWPLAGDQFYVDFDLSDGNLPPGSQLAIGDAIVEVTAEPHLGCKKFIERYGVDACKFVNSRVGKSLNLRGINAKVVQAGKVTQGCGIVKLK